MKFSEDRLTLINVLPSDIGDDGVFSIPDRLVYIGRAAFYGNTR